MTINRDNKSKLQILDEYSSIQPAGIKKCLRGEDVPADNRAAAQILKTINSYYGYLNNAQENPPSVAVDGCFAVRLAFLLVDAVSSGKCPLTAQGRFKKSFYTRCMQKAHESGLADEIGDDGLLIIYIKQCLNLLTVGGILRKKGAAASVAGAALSSRAMFHRLFSSFWDLASWEDIFPSDPESARDLKTSRHVLKDLALRHYGAVRMNDIANDFFDMTGFSVRNNLMAISFIDFYFFTWLRHFGMIRYSTGPELAPVSITVTDAGRTFLSSI